MKRSHANRLAVFIALGVVAVATEPANAQNTAIIPAPFQEQRHLAFVEEARRGGIDCLLMGDSITDWWRRAGLEVYEANFAELDCANFRDRG
jgi:hypothetical protein